MAVVSVAPPPTKHTAVKPTNSRGLPTSSGTLPVGGEIVFEAVPAAASNRALEQQAISKPKPPVPTTGTEASPTPLVSGELPIQPNDAGPTSTNPGAQKQPTVVRNPAELPTTVASPRPDSVKYRGSGPWSGGISGGTSSSFAIEGRVQLPSYETLNRNGTSTSNGYFGSAAYTLGAGVPSLQIGNFNSSRIPRADRQGFDTSSVTVSGGFSSEFQPVGSVARVVGIESDRARLRESTQSLTVAPGSFGASIANYQFAVDQLGNQITIGGRQEPFARKGLEVNANPLTGVGAIARLPVGDKADNQSITLGVGYSTRSELKAFGLIPFIAHVGILKGRGDNASGSNEPGTLFVTAPDETKVNVPKMVLQDWDSTGLVVGVAGGPGALIPGINVISDYKPSLLLVGQTERAIDWDQVVGPKVNEFWTKNSSLYNAVTAVLPQNQWPTQTGNTLLLQELAPHRANKRPEVTNRKKDDPLTAEKLYNRIVNNEAIRERIKTVYGPEFLKDPKFEEAFKKQMMAAVPYMVQPEPPQDSFTAVKDSMNIPGGPEDYTYGWKPEESFNQVNVDRQGWSLHPKMNIVFQQRDLDGDGKPEKYFSVARQWDIDIRTMKRPDRPNIQGSLDTAYWKTGYVKTLVMPPTDFVKVPDGATEQDIRHAVGDGRLRLTGSKVTEQQVRDIVNQGLHDRLYQKTEAARDKFRDDRTLIDHAVVEYLTQSPEAKELKLQQLPYGVTGEAFLKSSMADDKIWQAARKAATTSTQPKPDAAPQQSAVPPKDNVPATQPGTPPAPVVPAASSATLDPKLVQEQLRNEFSGRLKVLGTTSLILSSLAQPKNRVELPVALRETAQLAAMLKLPDAQRALEESAKAVDGIIKTYGMRAISEQELRNAAEYKPNGKPVPTEISEIRSVISNAAMISNTAQEILSDFNASPVPATGRK